MVMTVADPIFIDTNVLVFATIPRSPMHRPAMAALHAIAMSGAETWISRQIVRELPVYLTRPGVYNPAMAATAATVQVANLMTIYRVADESRAVTSQLLDFLRTVGAAGKQVHDANIVATMQVYGIPRLLKHNVADFARFSSLITVVPLSL